MIMADRGSLVVFLRLSASALALSSLPVLAAEPAFPDFIEIEGGRLIMGDPLGEPDEVTREVMVDPFRLMRHEVTNQAFASFVRDSGHRTDPETGGSGYVWTGRWDLVDGADWRHPFGPASTIDGREDHPVVQVSARDAMAYCAFHGWRLPSEEEWMFAARGRDGRRYPWGGEDPDQTDDATAALANFGTVPCCAADDRDGFLTTAPVGSFPRGRGPFGHLDLAGNVWEWTASPFPGQSGKVVLKGGGWGNNPYCLRVSYSHGNEPAIGLDMVGFRCAEDR